MTNKSIGGHLDTPALGLLYGDRPGAALAHRPEHTRALQDGRDQLRRAIAALSTYQLPNASDAARTNAIVAGLRGQLGELERVLGGSPQMAAAQPSLGARIGTGGNLGGNGASGRQPNDERKS